VGFRFGWQMAASNSRSKRPSSRVEACVFVAIVGPTGCGKSTLLNVAAAAQTGIGHRRIFDAQLEGLNRRRLSVPADGLFPWKTAIDNVAIGLEIWARARPGVLKKGRQGWLAVGRSRRVGNVIPHVSGGSRKRVGPRKC